MPDAHEGRAHVALAHARHLSRGSFQVLLCIAAVLAAVAFAGSGAVSAQAVPERFDVRPVPGRVVRGWSPPARRYGPGHVGILMDASGDSVTAGLGGVVTFAGSVAGTSYVTVRHPSGLMVRYGRLSDVHVRTGQVVGAGAVLAGGAELSGGPLGLLHLSVSLDGRYLDPARFLPRPRVHLTR